MAEILDALQYIADWFGDLKDASDSWFEQFLLWLAAWYVEMKIWVLEMAWSFASTILESLNLGTLVNNAFGHLDSTVLAYLNFFRVLDCVNLLLNAVVTRFLLNLIGW